MSRSRKWAESYPAAYYMIIAGLGLALVGLWFVIDGAVFLSKTQRVSGTVVSLDKVRGGKGMPLYYPIVSFQRTDMVEPVIFKSRPGLWPSPFAAGDQVTVAYLRDDPPSARVVSFWTLWFLPACTVLLGTGCMVAGRSTLRMRRRDKTGANRPMTQSEEMASFRFQSPLPVSDGRAAQDTDVS